MNVKLVPVDAYRVDGYLSVGARSVKVATMLCDGYGWAIQQGVRHRRFPGGCCTRTVDRVDGHRRGDRDVAEQRLLVVCLRQITPGLR